MGILSRRSMSMLGQIVVILDTYDVISNTYM